MRVVSCYLLFYKRYVPSEDVDIFSTFYIVMFVSLFMCSNQMVECFLFVVDICKYLFCILFGVHLLKINVLFLIFLFFS